MLSAEERTRLRNLATRLVELLDGSLPDVAIRLQTAAISTLIAEESRRRKQSGESSQPRQSIAQRLKAWERKTPTLPERKYHG